MLFPSSCVVLATDLAAESLLVATCPGSKLAVRKPQSIHNWILDRDVTSDPYQSRQPVRVVRPTKSDSGFVSDVTSTDITRSIGNSYLPSEQIHSTVAGGDNVTIHWSSWPLGHYGPVLNYMAKCPDEGCSSFLADMTDSDAPWFKIQQGAFDVATSTWASDILANNDASYDVTIPKNIASGYYLLRHENLALHGASSEGGAQFYPVCVQLEVTGGGDMEPSGLSFPGAYNMDAGILFNVYLSDESNAAYVPPGGDVYPGLND